MPASPDSGPVISPLSPSQRLSAIEYARGGACLAVLLFHSLTALPPESLHPVLRLLRRVTESGWLGVNVFFAVSGWCIAERLAAARRRDESVLHFLRERALRIYPAYWAALALLFLVRAAAAPFNTTSLAQNFPASPAAWIGDLLLVQPYLATPAALVVSWSLVYELGFYALGAAALVLHRRGLPTALLLGLGVLLSLPASFQAIPRPLYVLGLWPDFFAGVLAWRAARATPDATARWSMMLLLAFLIATVALHGRFGDSGRIVALVTAALLALASRFNAPAAPRGVLACLAWLGGISYSLYLAHVTVLSPFINLGARWVSPHHLGFGVIWLAAVATALFAGWALHRWVEAPCERWRKHRWGRRPLAVVAT